MFPVVETTGYVLKKIVNKANLFYKLPPVLTGGVFSKNRKGFSQIVDILAKAF
ncbi:hypothetical protein NU08_3325 [Flavobacterium anhuiense]|uniref:Uncharacterized protein n=1 Tax=Flavobacterium anhuiense TaxID=459526 RepID=A0A444VV34_9FLAO|nr:hypothetical protein NU08_3325 [Flavobacterium anhuiense]